MYRILFALGYFASVAEYHGDSEKYEKILKLAFKIFMFSYRPCSKFSFIDSDLQLVSEALHSSPNPLDFSDEVIKNG